MFCMDYDERVDIFSYGTRSPCALGPPGLSDAPATKPYLYLCL